MHALSSLSLEEFPTKTGWEKVGFVPHHGINIPLFSLRSKKGCGIGEFLDLIPLISWCKEIGFDVIQLLPLNDTGLEPSPYNALSSLALHPIFLSLWALPHMHKHTQLQRRLTSLQKLNHYKRIPFSLVLVGKMDFLKEYYNSCFQEFQEDPSYLAFTKKHTWLADYALFKAYKAYTHHQPWSSWPATLHPQLLPKEASTFHIFLQYLCFTQFAEIKKTAEKEGVLLKGDIPILISPESTDVWLDQQDFDLTLEAGAPPDMYAPEGQSWGFPIYNWEMIKKNGYRFWKNRLSLSTELYDIFRIDHIIGFFRIWALPRGGKANEGHYIPQVEEEMLQQGERLLTMLLDSLPMLPIGEDLGLGIALPEIRASLEKLGIPGTKIPRWEKKGPLFLAGTDYSPLSLTSISTHDSETLALWWHHFPEEAELFALSRAIPYQQKLTSAIRFKILEDSHHSASLFHINLLPEYLALFPELIHETPEEERINIPGTIGPHNWSYRLRPTVEELLSHHSLKTALKALK